MLSLHLTISHFFPEVKIINAEDQPFLIPLPSSNFTFIFSLTLLPFPSLFLDLWPFVHLFIHSSNSHISVEFYRFFINKKQMLSLVTSFHRLVWVIGIIHLVLPKGKLKLTQAYTIPQAVDQSSGRIQISASFQYIPLLLWKFCC